MRYPEPLYKCSSATSLHSLSLLCLLKKLVKGVKIYFLSRTSSDTRELIMIKKPQSCLWLVSHQQIIVQILPE